MIFRELNENDNQFCELCWGNVLKKESAEVIEKCEECENTKHHYYHKYCLQVHKEKYGYNGLHSDVCKCTENKTNIFLNEEPNQDIFIDWRFFVVVFVILCILVLQMLILQMH